MYYRMVFILTVITSDSVTKRRDSKMISITVSNVRVRVISSFRRAGSDRVRLSTQDVFETGYAPSRLMSGMTFTSAYYVYIRDSSNVLSTDL